MKTYYHINKDPNCQWKEGDLIDFKGKNNYYWKGLIEQGDYITLNGKEYPSNLVTEKALEVYKREKLPPREMKDYHFHPIATLEQTFQSLGNSMRLNRELIFENIRTEFYPDLPSRHKCIWLIPDNKKSIEFWKETLRGNKHRIFKVSVEGEVHRSAQKWLIGGTLSVNEWITMAHKYWKGVDSGNLQDEILFVGKMKIIKDNTGI